MAGKFAFYLYSSKNYYYLCTIQKTFDMEQVKDILIGREAEIRHLDAIVSSKEAEFVVNIEEGWHNSTQREEVDFSRSLVELL